MLRRDCANSRAAFLLWALVSESAVACTFSCGSRAEFFTSEPSSTILCFTGGVGDVSSVVGLDLVRVHGKVYQWSSVSTGLSFGGSGKGEGKSTWRGAGGV